MAGTHLSNNAIVFTENQHGTAVLDKLRAQREQERCCDVIIYVAGENFQAHKCVLAACSPYFDSMFKGRANKSTKEQLTISCQDAEVFHCLLGYMYTGTVIINTNNAPELLKLANKLLLIKLTEHCAEYLERYLHVTNCLTVLEMAKKFNLEALAKATQSLIASCMDDVIKCEEILDYPLKKLEDFIKCSDWQINDEQMLQLVSSWVHHDMTQRVVTLRSLLTWVSWSKIKPEKIIELLQEHRLYRNSHYSTFFILDALNDHGLLLKSLEEDHTKLKARFSHITDLNVDNERFINLAVETAIRKVPDEEGQRVPPVSRSEIDYSTAGTSEHLESNCENETNDRNPVAFDKPINHVDNSMLQSETSDHVSKLLFDNCVAKYIVENNKVADVDECSMMQEETTMDSTYHHPMVNRTANHEMSNCTQLPCTTENEYPSSFIPSTLPLIKTIPYPDSNEDTCSLEQNQIYMKAKYNSIQNTQCKDSHSNQNMDQQVMVKQFPTRDIYHKNRRIYPENPVAFYVNEYDPEAEEVVDKKKQPANPYLVFNHESNSYNNRNFSLQENQHHMQQNISNQGNMEDGFANYYTDESSGPQDLNNQNQMYFNDSSCDTQNSNCPQDMTMPQNQVFDNQSNKRFLTSGQDYTVSDFINTDLRDQISNHKDQTFDNYNQPTNLVRRDMNKSGVFHNDVENSWINNSVRPSKDDHKSPNSLQKILQMFPEMPETLGDEYHTLEPNLDVQRPLNLDNLDSSLKQVVLGPNIGEGLQRNNVNEFSFDSNENNRLCHPVNEQHSMASNNCDKKIIDNPEPLNMNNNFSDPKNFSQNNLNEMETNKYGTESMFPPQFKLFQDPNLGNEHLKKEKQLGNDDNKEQAINYHRQATDNRQTSSSSDLTNLEDVPRHVKFRIVKNMANSEKFLESFLKETQSDPGPQTQEDIEKQNLQSERQDQLNSDLNDDSKITTVDIDAIKQRPENSNNTTPTNKQEDSSNSTVKTCNLCQATFPIKKQYIAHMKEHFPGPPHQCNQCCKNFKKIYHLLEHLVTHQEVKAHKCPYCPFSTHKKFNLTEHLMNHKGEKPYKCKTCGEGFVRAQILKTHESKHSTGKPFLCETCGWSGKTRNLLLVHNKIHTGDMYSCQYENCAYRTAKKSHLKDHMQCHTSSRPYKCQQCFKGFATSTNYHRHMKTHSNNKLQCSHCDYSCFRTDHLSEHVKKKHTNKNIQKPKIRRHQLKKKDSMRNYLGSLSPKIKPNQSDMFSDIESTNISLQPQIPGTPPPTTLSEYPSSPAYTFEHREDDVDDPLMMSEMTDVTDGLADGGLFNRSFSQGLSSSTNCQSPNYSNAPQFSNTLSPSHTALNYTNPTTSQEDTSLNFICLIKYT